MQCSDSLFYLVITCEPLAYSLARVCQLDVGGQLRHSQAFAYTSDDRARQDLKSLTYCLGSVRRSQGRDWYLMAIDLEVFVWVHERCGVGRQATGKVGSGAQAWLDLGAVSLLF